MIQATLANELKSLKPTNIELEAAQALTNAYGVFASAAAGSGIPISPAGVESGKTAMLSALTGMSAPGAGTTAIPTAVIAFWTAVCGGFAVSFIGSIASTPPPHASIASAFAALMSANTAGKVSLDDAANSMATIMYADAIIGGIVVLPPSVPGPIL